AVGRTARAALAAAGLALVVVAFGAVTANTAGAPQACQGFPLCNGTLLPAAEAAQVHIHWTHRVVAFLLFFHIMGATFAAYRRGAPRAIRRAATVALALVTLQLALAAALVLAFLPRSLQAAHLATGAAIWFAVVVWAALARRDVRSATVRATDMA
ncbi:MAG: COX15/CtaA family protein, partial [Longimicrobiales bacterium]